MFCYENVPGITVASRRFIYCWKKNAKGEWDDLGVLLTDDWGQPWYLGPMVEDTCKDSKVRVMTRPHSPEDNTEELPFGFYTAEQALDFEFRTTEQMDFRACFVPGEEYAFIPAPLDTVRGDATILLDDPRGFYAPAGYETSQQVDVNGLISSGRATALKIPEPATISDPFDKNGGRIKTIQISLEANFAEYVSLIKKHTALLDRALAFDIDAKKQFRSAKSYIDQILNIISLMIQHGKGERYTDEELKDVLHYKERIQELAEHIDDNYIGGSKAFAVESQIHYAGQDNAGVPVDGATKALHEFVPITDRAQQLLDLLSDSRFIELCCGYFESIKQNGYAQQESDFFSLKHPLVTVCDALQDAFLALSMVPGQAFAEKVYKNEIAPLENTCIRMFDDLSRDDELKEHTRDMVTDLQALLTDYETDIINGIITPDSDAQASPAQTLLAGLWNIVSDSHVTGFFNNQAGPASTFARIRMAYAYFHNKWALSNPTVLKAVSIRQLKFCMIQAKYMVASGHNLSIYKVRKQFVRLTAVRTETFEVRRDTIKDIDEFSQAGPALNALSCGIQFVAAAYTMYGFFTEKEKPQQQDYVKLIDSVANAGLALSGFRRRHLDKLFNLGKGAAGKLFAGVSALCSMHSASMDAAQHERYGNEVMANLSAIKFAMSGVGAGAWFYALAAGCGMSGPIGWALFGGGLAFEGIALVNEKMKPGSQNMVLSLLTQLDSAPGFRTKHKEIVCNERKVVIPARRILHDNGLVVPRKGEELTVTYSFAFEPALNHKSFKHGWAWETFYLKQDIPFKALNHNTCLNLFVEQQWETDMLLNLFYDGLFKEEDNSKVNMEVRMYATAWRDIYRTENREDLEDMKRKFQERLKLYA